MMAAAAKLQDAPSFEDEKVADVLREQLERICTDPLFSETTRMKRFLRYVVEETLDGRAHLLKGYSIGLEVFDRPESFDPQADTIVRVQAGQLRRRLDLYYAGSGKSDSARIMIPKGSYVPKFELRKLTDQTVDSSTLTLEAIRQAEIKALDPPLGPGILVTNFDVIGGEASDVAFAMGMTAEVSNALVQFRYLRVVTRTASVAEALTTKSVKELGVSYDAAYALSGSVRCANDLVRVTVNLVETSSGKHVYSRSYDRQYSVDNLLEIQEEIASYVASEVGSPYGVVNRVRHNQLDDKPDINAYEAILKFYAFTAQPSIAGYPEIIKLLEETTEKSPRYSSAWAALSLMYSFEASQDMFAADGDALLQKALKSARRAVAIDSRNALAFYALFTAQFHTNDLEGYRKSAAQAVTLNPNNDSLLAFYGVTLALIDEGELARGFAEKALEMNASAPEWYKVPALVEQLFDEDYEGILKAVLPNITPEFMWGHPLAVASYGHLNRPKQATALFEQLKLDPEVYVMGTLNMIKLWNFSARLSETLTTGWEKAGIRVSNPV